MLDTRGFIAYSVCVCVCALFKTVLALLHFFFSKLSFPWHVYSFTLSQRHGVTYSESFAHTSLKQQNLYHSYSVCVFPHLCNSYIHRWWIILLLLSERWPNTTFLFNVFCCVYEHCSLLPQGMKRNNKYPS